MILNLQFNSGFCAEIVQNNGLNFITGKGCGVKTPIKYLTELPKDIQNHECSIIKPDLNGDQTKIETIRM